MKRIIAVLLIVVTLVCALSFSAGAVNLQGKMAGVNITSANTKPGASMQIRIRGVRSLNASNDPLIVIDGIPVNNDALSAINPNDIETISVLKDASATAIYGSRAANGVILITTNQEESTPETKAQHKEYCVPSVGKIAVKSVVLAVKTIGRTVNRVISRFTPKYYRFGV